MTDLSSIDVTAVDGISVVRVHGEVDLSNVERVQTAIESAAGREAHGLVIDLSDLAYLDSAGVRLLFQIAQTIEHGVVAVVPDDSPVRRVLDLADVASVIPLVQSEDEAVRRVKDRAST